MKIIRPFVIAIMVYMILTVHVVNAQDPLRFSDQVRELVRQVNTVSGKGDIILFTGSSTIRMWKDIQSYFPGYNIVNNGFGGSHMSDLLYYCDELIVRPAPKKIFIYEGDNDIAGNKTPAQIFKTAKELTGKIQKDLPGSEIIFISPKPSIARWNLKKKYGKLNRKFQRLDKREDQIQFANLWDCMLDSDGIVFQDIFIEDGLHMNKKGYDLLAKELVRFLN